MIIHVSHPFLYSPLPIYQSLPLGPRDRAMVRQRIPQGHDPPLQCPTRRDTFQLL